MIDFDNETYADADIELREFHDQANQGGELRCGFCGEVYWASDAEIAYAHNNGIEMDCGCRPA